MAHAARFSVRPFRALGLFAFLRSLLRKEQPPHWTEYLRNSHRR